MKKLSIVLLALLFVSGSLFAADLSVTGDATASFSWDLENGSIGFDAVNNGVKVDFNIELGSGSAESTGSGDLYAYMKASGSLKLNSGLTIDADVKDADGKLYTNYALVMTSLKLDAFKIFAGDFTIDLLGAPTALDKAKGFTPIGAKDPVNEVKGALTKANGGVTVLYQDLTLGFDFLLDNDYADLAMLVYGGWAGDMDGMKLSVAAGYSADTYLAFSAAADLDLDGTAVKVAVDLADVIDNFAVDVAVGAVLDLGDLKPAVNVYFANKAGDTWLGAQAKLSGLDFGLAVLGITVEGTDVLDAWKYAADVKSTVDAIEVGVFGNYAHDDTYEIGGSLKLTDGGLTLFGKGTYKNTNVVPLEVSATSTDLINNAAVSLGWKTDNVTAGAGKITAAVKVSL